MTNDGATYKDDDLVYVDPDAKTVVGIVEWTTTGKPKTLMRKSDVESASDASPTEKPKGRGAKRPQRVRYYPWGTYRSMKNVYKLEGKQPRSDTQATLDDVLEKALQQPFWD